MVTLTVTLLVAILFGYLAIADLDDVALAEAE